MPNLTKSKEFDDAWVLLRKTVKTVMALQKINCRQWINAITDVFAFFKRDPEHGGFRLYVAMDKYFHRHVFKIYEGIGSSNEELLVAYYKNWTKFSKGNEYINRLFYIFDSEVLDRKTKAEIVKKYGISKGQKVAIGQLGLDIWRRTIIEPLQCRLVHLLTEGIRLDRQGVCSNQPVLQGVILSFVQVEKYRRHYFEDFLPLTILKDTIWFYRDKFETPFLEDTSEYYQQVANRLIQENSCPQYMEKAVQLLDEEDFRSRKYLHPSSYDKVRKVCEQRLAHDNLDFLLSEFNRMVDEENGKDLQNLFILLKSNPSAVEILANVFQKHITNCGFEAINANKDDNTAQAFIESIMEVQDKFRRFIETIFSGDHRFVLALDKACTTIVNHKVNPKHMCRSPELLVRYCDSLLRRNAKTCSENEIEKEMNKAIAIFKYLDDKDVFQKFYIKMMARRIIYSQSMSIDAEGSMIEKLKQICGYEFTSKLHHIFTCVGVSNDLNSCFMENLRNNNVKLEINFSMLVFQHGGWPLGQSTDSEFAIPKELEKSVLQFESFYHSKFNGRKLTWLHRFSEGELKLRYLKKSYYVRMSTYQVAILLLYQRVNILSFEDISEMTKLSSEQLSKQIEGLLESKLLLATDSEKPVEPGSSFRLNTEYTNKRKKFRLSPVVQRDAPYQEVRKTHESVEQDRKGVIQAAIVRIMKSRKVLRHRNLMQEVINQVKDRFTPEVIMIKRCVENLIEMEYIERTVDSTDEYNYIA